MAVAAALQQASVFVISFLKSGRVGHLIWTLSSDSSGMMFGFAPPLDIIAKSDRIREFSQITLDTEN